MTEGHTCSKTVVGYYLRKCFKIRPARFEFRSVFDSYLPNKVHAMQSMQKSFGLSEIYKTYLMVKYIKSK